MTALPETERWPWELTTTDVIVRDPKTGAAGEWPVIGPPHYAHGHVIVDCTTEDGGEGVFVYGNTQKATVRAHATYTAPALLTDHQRCEAFLAMTVPERAFLVSQFIIRYGALFDAAYTQLQTARAAGAACLREDIAS